MILLVEDNKDDVKLTLRAFKQQNIKNEIIVVRDGVEALDFLFGRGIFQNRDTRIKPSVILLDLKLPKVDGLEVLKQIRKNKQTSFIPVVMLTTSREDNDVIQSYKLGVNSYIRKPVEFENFSEILGKLGLYWLLINITPVKT